MRGELIFVRYMPTTCIAFELLKYVKYCIEINVAEWANLHTSYR
jgi:hypothetical protein